MIQFNLLPDVKKQYIKAKRTKRLVFSVSTISAVAALVIVFMLFSVVQFAQKKNINDLSDDISSGIAQLESTNNLDEILTIQNQLNSIPGLHEDKPETSRLFSYLTQLTPADVSIGTFNLSFDGGTVKLEGSAPSIASINRFTDTLKYAKFTYKDKTEAGTSENSETSESVLAFSDVKTDLSRNEDTASYTITAVFDPLLFDNTKVVVLEIPSTVTTRSTQGKPDLSDNDDNPLFNSSNGGNQ